MYTFTLLSLHSILLITLVRLSYVDWNTRRVSNASIVSLLILAILWLYLKQRPFEGHLLSSCLGFILFFALRKIFTRLKKTTALGWGDVKLFSVLCLFLMPENFGAFCLWSGIFGIFTHIFWKKDLPFPFAPAISCAFGIIFWLKTLF